MAEKTDAAEPQAGLIGAGPGDSAPQAGAGGDEALIRAEGLVKRFGKVAALDRVCLSVRRGEIYGVAGLNGAGKSTLLSVLAGIMPPDEGAVYYRERDAYARKRESARERKSLTSGAGPYALRVGYVPQDIALFPDLSVYDNLKFWALAAAPPASDVKARVYGAASAAGLTDRLRERLSVLSGGMKRRVNIAAALATAPEILIMDEPTAGLDIKNRRDILNFVRGLAKAPPRAESVAAAPPSNFASAIPAAAPAAASPPAGLAVLFTSHQSGEIESFCDRLLLLDRGVPVFEGRPADAFIGKYKDFENFDDILYAIGGGL
ncbi:MAG: ABC transporter ATP-binding protein [Clostridiales bacterium]|jgi:ABC-2 type transport system ATP-binding protein|nr:ABC transporter ATP-binding protein [Clostridiales bacterium]